MTTYMAEPGTKLGGRYRLEDRIAAGSGWAAWKAIDETLARPVTVFTFAQGFPRIEDVVTAARAASRLTDPRLAQVFDVEDAWDGAYIVMEWAAGDTLGDMIATGPLEPARAARMIAEAAAALSSAHAVGVAHMCLSPGSLRWSQTGEVKVVGLGIDAALAGATRDDPVLADTRGLGGLLYAALTGCWPGPDYPSLPAAPLANGEPRSPRQVVAGIPATFSELACRAMQLSSRDGQPPVTTPAELSAALMAAMPPAPIPAAPPPPVRRERPPSDLSDPYWPGRRQQADLDESGFPGRSYQSKAPHTSQSGRSRGRRGQRKPPLADVIGHPLGVAAAGVVVAVAVVAVVALWPGTTPKPRPSKHSTHPTVPAASVATLKPVRASGFDPLTSLRNDPYNENSRHAKYAIDQSAKTAWTSQWYKSAAFGGLKSGAGLLIRMPKAETYRSVIVTFGSVPGADVELLVGNSAARSAANLHSMKTVAAAHDVSGTVAFHITSSATGRVLVIWFTKLPPRPHTPWYMAEVYNVVVRGLS